MTFPLPTGDFNFLGIDSMSNESIMDLIVNWDVNGEWGYIFEVDINVPLRLHDEHNELPFMAEQINGRLTPNLFNKTNYRTHVIILGQALKHGLELVKVHKIIKYKQSRWLKDYIQHNTNMRANTQVILIQILFFKFRTRISGISSSL